MSEIAVQEHVLYALRNAAIQRWPFPHFYAENVFPADFYAEMLAQLDTNSTYESNESKYHGRKFGNANSLGMLEWMNDPEFMQHIAMTFADQMKQRYQGRKCGIYHDLRLVRDQKGYYIGPHTDAPWKLVSLLFYLPYTDMHAEHGTSLYVPKNSKMRCPGGPHHGFEGFQRVATMPFRANTCFGFFKTDNSFHGVETINDRFRRDVLLYNLYDQEIYSQAHPAKSMNNAPAE